MSGNYYDLSTTKKILTISETDIIDDELLNAFGELANQHIDNVLAPFDEGIPYITTSILEDVKAAANYYTISLYKGKKQDFEASKFWKEMFKDIIDTIKNRKNNTGNTTIISEGFGRMSSEGYNHDVVW